MRSAPRLRRLLGAAALTALLALPTGAAAEEESRPESLVRERRRDRREALAQDLNLAEQEQAAPNGCPIDHTGLLSPATACCYQKLVKHPECCLDKDLTKGPTHRWVQRPGTEWHCHKSSGCWDTLTGLRGRDLMWIPEGADCDTPRILYIHGGSWMYGSPNTTGYPQFGTKLAAATGAVLFVIDYPLVPYGNFSTILESAIAGLSWLADNGPFEHCRGALRGEKTPPLFVAGDSSGGGSAMSLVLQLNAEPRLLQGRHLSGAFMFSPWTNLMCNTPEYYSNAFAKISSPRTFKDLSPLQLYVGDIIFQSVTTTNADEFSANAVEYIGTNHSLQTDPIASSYFAEPKHFSGPNMPPLHIAVGGSESILGDSVRVANTAARGGAEVSVEIYNGMWHVFPMYSEGCGSGEELWAAVNAIASAGMFVQAAAKASRGKHCSPSGFCAEEPKMKLSLDGFPRINYMYDPMVDRFDRVGELMPHTSATLSQTVHNVMKTVEAQPWYVVLPAMIGSTTLIFMSGCLLGALTDFGGREAYKRARRVSDYRQQFIEVPVEYVNLEALHAAHSHGADGAKPRSFLADFVLGVPDEDGRPVDAQARWRGATARAKAAGSGEEADQACSTAQDCSAAQARVQDAREENAAWRRMAMGTYEPPPTPPKVQVSFEDLKEETQRLLPADQLLAQVAESPGETWAVSTMEAKDGDIEAARRENMAFRMQAMQIMRGKPC